MKEKNIAHCSLGLRRFFICILCLSVLLSLPGIQQATARKNVDLFNPNMFNITPGTTTSSQEYCDVAYNLDLDEWLVVWVDDRSGTNTGIYGRLVDKDGNLNASELNFKDNDNLLKSPAVAYDDYRERYLVVWDNETTQDIEGRLLNGNGTFYNDVFTVYNCTHGCGRPDVAYNPIMDQYLVVWDMLDGSGYYDIYDQRVSDSGTPTGSANLVAGGPTDTHQADPAVAVIPSTGKYRIVFERDNKGDYDIAGRRLDIYGATDTTAFAISTSSDNERTPDVAVRPNDGLAYVAWQHDTGSGVNIEGTYVESDNSKGSVKEVGDVGYNDVLPSVTYASPFDQFLVVWSTTYDYDVYGQYVNPNNTFEDGAFQITDDTLDQWQPRVSFGTNRYLAAFKLYINPQNDIYGRIGPFQQIYLPIVSK
jgi:hypothetical protein